MTNDIKWQIEVEIYCKIKGNYKFRWTVWQIYQNTYGAGPLSLTTKMSNKSAAIEIATKSSFRGHGGFLQLYLKAYLRHKAIRLWLWPLSHKFKLAIELQELCPTMPMSTRQSSGAWKVTKGRGILLR